MAEVPAYLLVHTVQAEPFLGTGAKGDVYGPAVTVAGFVEDSRRVVRDADGDEVISEATIITRLEQAPHLTPKSRVLLPSGRSALVIVAKHHDDGGLGAPQHLEVNLT